MTWQPLTRERQDQTQLALEEIIGLSEQVYVHSVHAAQGHRHFADPALPPRERKDILTAGLGLGKWEQLKNLVSHDTHDVERDLDGIAQRLGAFEEDLAHKAEWEGERNLLFSAAEDATEAAERADEAQERARDELARVKAVADRVAVLTAQRETASQAVKALEAKLAAAGTASAKVEALLAEVDRLAPLAAQVESLELEGQRLASAAVAREASLAKQASLGDREAALTMDADEASLEAQQLRASARDIREAGAGQTCDKCGQELHGEALQKALAAVAREAAGVEANAERFAAKARGLAESLAEVRRELAECFVPPVGDPDAEKANAAALALAREAVFETASHQATIAQLRESLVETSAPDFNRRLEDARASLAAREAEIKVTAPPTAETLRVLEQGLTGASTALTAARAADRAAQTALAGSEERLRRLQELEGRAQEALADKTRLTTRLDVLKGLERAYGRDGIPVLLLETLAIPQMETEARRVLEALGMPFRVELVTQRENKGGGLKDTLDVVVHEPNGARAYSTFSGGERSRIEVALRIALARLIAQRSSSHCSLLALDEVSYLDRSGQAALVEVLRGLTEFSSIVVVSHDEVLSEGFDQTVTVVRDEAGSRLETSA